MGRVALVGPEIEENLSLRYLCSSLAPHGFATDIVAFNHDGDFGPAIETILAAQPDIVGISLAFQWRASDFLALAVALRERGYRGHITAGGHFATFASLELLREFPELDSIVRQEAEGTIVTLARAVTSGAPFDGIAGLAVRDENGVPRVNEHAKLPDLGEKGHVGLRFVEHACERWPRKQAVEIGRQVGVLAERDDLVRVEERRRGRAVGHAEVLAPIDPQVLDMYAAVLFDLKQFEEAATMQRKAVACLPEDVNQAEFLKRLRTYEARASARAP